jgi:hypothetical protein
MREPLFYTGHDFNNVNLGNQRVTKGNPKTNHCVEDNKFLASHTGHPLDMAPAVLRRACTCAGDPWARWAEGLVEELAESLAQGSAERPERNRRSSRTAKQQQGVRLKRRMVAAIAKSDTPALLTLSKRSEATFVPRSTVANMGD